MKRSAHLIAVFALLVSANVSAQDIPTRGPDSLLSYTATVTSSSPKEIVLHYTAVTLDSGYYKDQLLLPDGFAIDSERTTIFSGLVHDIGDTIVSVAYIEMPPNGYYWSHLMVTYQPLKVDSINVNFALLRTNPLYYEVNDSSLDSISYIPDSIFYPPMSAINSATHFFGHGLTVLPINDGFKLVLTVGTELQVNIFDPLGRQIQFSKTLFLSAGRHTVNLGLPRGVWFAEVRCDNSYSFVKLISF